MNNIQEINQNPQQTQLQNPQSNPYQYPQINSYQNPYQNPQSNPYENPQSNPYQNSLPNSYQNSQENPYQNPYQNPQPNPTQNPQTNAYQKNLNQNPQINPSNDGFQAQNNFMQTVIRSDIPAFGDPGAGVNNPEEKSLLSGKTRRDFISKVYCVLSLQILMTVGMSVFGMYNHAFNEYLRDFNSNYYMLLIAFGISIVVLIALVCCHTAARKVPLNYILLLLFTLCESYIVAFICASSDSSSVLYATILTLGKFLYHQQSNRTLGPLYYFFSILILLMIFEKQLTLICKCICMQKVMFLSLTLYALTTKSDITMKGGLLFVCCAVFAVAGIFMIFIQSNVAHIIYSCIGVILFSMYIIYDTQLLLDNKKLHYTIDDYVIASLKLYLDIINLFLHLLSILQRAKS